MNEKELEEQLIFKTVAGSHCYGMNTATSDEDIRGIVVLKDPKYYIGFGLHNFEQKDSWEDGNDRVYYDVRKAIKLMAENNPNMLELMFIEERFWRHTTPQWQLLVDNRELFISARVGYSYGGYAISQIKKIERHRKWLIDPPKKRPEKKDYNLDDFVSHEQLGAFNKLLADLIKNQLLILNLSASTMEEITKLDFDAYAKTITEPSEENVETVSVALHFTKELTERLLREKKFQSDLKHYESYLSWRDNRNKKRRDLEAKFGYDTKFASQAMRLLINGEEILEGKGLIVFRPDAEELLAIKNGKYKFDELMEIVKEKETKLLSLAKTTKLQKTPNLNKIDDLCQQIIQTLVFK